MAEYRVLLVDDQEVFRGICRSAPMAFSKLYPGSTIEMEYANSVLEARRQLEESADWSVILIDLNLEDDNKEQGGLRFLKELAAENNLQKRTNLKELHIDNRNFPAISIFTASKSTQSLKECLSAGATGYISKDSGGVEVFCKAIHSLIIDGVYVTSGIRDILSFKEPQQPNLTGSEVAVIEKLLENKSNSEIADELSIKISTVTRYSRSAYKKFGRNSVVGLLLKLMREESELNA